MAGLTLRIAPYTQVRAVLPICGSSARISASGQTSPAVSNSGCTHLKRVRLRFFRDV